MHRTMFRGLLVLAIVGVAGYGVLAVLLGPPTAAEADRLADLLGLREQMTLGEIGAGRGELTVELARRMGPKAHVFATELNPVRLDQIAEAVREANLTNVTVIQAEARSSNLGPECCDAIFMRRVYHHLSDPVALARDWGRSLKPGGRLVIIELESGKMPMGVDRSTLVGQVTTGGLRFVSNHDWPVWGHYAAVFEKPGA